jgi:hypothetical protein
MSKELIAFKQAILTRRVVARYMSKVGMEHDTPEAMKEYLKDHPGADKSNHTVKKQDDGGEKKPESKSEEGGKKEESKGKGNSLTRKLDRLYDDPDPDEVGALLKAWPFTRENQSLSFVMKGLTGQHTDISKKDLDGAVKYLENMSEKFRDDGHEGMADQCDGFQAVLKKTHKKWLDKKPKWQR